MALLRVTPRRTPVLPVPLPRALFSSSSPFPPPLPPANDPDAAHSPTSSPPPNPGAPRNPSSSPFQDIRDRLRSSLTSPSARQVPTNLPRPNPASGAPSPKLSLEEVRRMLGDFHPTGGAPSPSPSSSAPGVTPSLMDLLRSRVDKGPNSGQGVTGFGDSIRQSFKYPPPPTSRRPPNPYLTPSRSNIFNPELERKAVGAGKEQDSAIALLRNYSYEELGKRLGELRPAVAAKEGKEWFSLKELQGRIAKLAELEKQENQSAGKFKDIRNCIANLDTKLEKPVQYINILNLGGQLMPDYMSRPPQEELLEKYFHPDHMSSGEKMKLELQRVRDEFKMSENDCGSARVQIAQLTLKIKHLSAVLHKKDKHSRKGLQEMVQQRKKYLKYLRRTDWDSYCLVLSKLGLRDVPEYKAPDYKSKATTKAKSKKRKVKSKGKKRKVKA